MAQLHTVFLPGETVDCPFTGWTLVFVVQRNVDEVSPIKSTMAFRA
jgi:hypothetical protein